MKLKTGKQQKKIKETKKWFFVKIYKIDKLLHRLTKKGRDKTQMTNIRNTTKKKRKRNTTTILCPQIYTTY